MVSFLRIAMSWCLFTALGTLRQTIYSVIGQSDKFFFANLSRTGFFSNLLTEGILFPKRKASAAHQLEILREWQANKKHVKDMEKMIQYPDSGSSYSPKLIQTVFLVDPSYIQEIYLKVILIHLSLKYLFQTWNHFKDNLYRYAICKLQPTVKLTPSYTAHPQAAG